MDTVKLYRKRLIPQETVLLKDDSLIYQDDKVLVTCWRVLRPRKDFAKGISCYFLEKGYKISRFLKEDGELVYYYCDIIDTQYDAVKNAYIMTDLLADVIIEKDGTIRLLDLGEIGDALERNLISVDLVKKCMWRLENLLGVLYGGGLSDLTKPYMDMGEKCL